MIQRILVLCLALALGTTGWSQGVEVVELTHNPALFKPLKAKRSGGGDSATIIYLEDTIHVHLQPFIDDFSSNRLKQYNAEPSDPGLIQELQVLFRVDGQVFQTFEASLEPTYIIEKLQNGDLDSTAKASLEVIFYNNIDFEETPFDTITVWQSFHTNIVGGITSTLPIDPDTVLINIIDTICLVPDNDNSLWVVEAEQRLVGGGVFVNNTWGIDPPTIGMATFDGWDDTGFPYDFTSQNSFDVADILTSKPFALNINELTGLPFDSIYISFYYQGEGWGDSPEEIDSLILEFYDVDNDEWVRAWGAGGNQGLTDFEKVAVEVPTDLRDDGFRFRFLNYASLFGIWDHWHIDYVMLGPDVSPGDLEDDVAFRHEPPSFLEDYTAMPWRHFQQSADKAAFAKSSLPLSFNNVGDKSGVNSHSFTIYDENDNLTFTSTTITNSSVQALAPFTSSIPVSSSDLDLMFPDSPEERQSFRVVHELSFSNDFTRRFNDTVEATQEFGSFYAYDDGTIEKAMSVTGEDTKLAIQYGIESPDTLKALLCYFPPHFEDYIGRSFFPTVWSSLEPEAIVYQGNLANPRYGSLNDFARIELDSFIVVSDTFYVGWKQRDPEEIFLGLDVNTNNRDKVFFDVGFGWENPVFDGTVMVRPDFGNGIFPVGLDDVTNNTSTFSIQAFPNPANESLTVRWDSDQPVQARLVDLSGRMVLNGSLQSGDVLDVSQLANGVYLLQGELPTGATTVSKIVIQH